jgi:carboxymethylenebutenolidase
MNIFPQSTCWRNEPAGGAPCLRFGLPVIAGLAFLIASAGAQNPLMPFLEDFKAKNDPPILVKDVTIISAVEPVKAYLARPDSTEKLPAILLIHGEDGLTPWMKLNAREISSIGYVVLAVDLRHRLNAKSQTADEEKALAGLSAALRWLRRRPDVWPDRVGVVGWSWGGGMALALAATAPVPACVVCDGLLPDDPALIAGLERTAVLGIFSAQSKADKMFGAALKGGRIAHAIHVYAGTKGGFMGPPEGKEYAGEAAEQAWFEIYEFLGKYVEDAGLPALPARPAPEKPLAGIADIMRAVNQPEGVRGSLIQALKTEPADASQWKQVRAYAVILAEAGGWLENLKPPKGSQRHWREQTHDYRVRASRILAAADRHDYDAARQALEALGNQCAACHKQHR